MNGRRCMRLENHSFTSQFYAVHRINMIIYLTFKLINRKWKNIII